MVCKLGIAVQRLSNSFNKKTLHSLLQALGVDVHIESIGTLINRLERCRKRSEQARSQAEKYAYAACNKLGIDPVSAIHRAPPKELVRVLQKAYARYDGCIEDVADVCRLQVRLPTNEDVLAARSMYTAGRAGDFTTLWDDKGVELVSSEDMISHPKSRTLYMAIDNKYIVHMNNGQKQRLEIQFIPEKMAPYYERTHVYLENIRNIVDNVAMQGRVMSPDEILQVRNYEKMTRDIHYEGIVASQLDELITVMPRESMDVLPDAGQLRLVA